MSTHETKPSKSVRPPAAERALAEAAARRAKLNVEEKPREVSGCGGLDPVRYGDWEVKGIAYDF